MDVRRTVLYLLVLSLAGACTRGPTGAGSEYQDPQGWALHVPPGWHVVQFDLSKAGGRARGATFSNVALPTPQLVPDYPLQANGVDLPLTGIALIVAATNASRPSQPVSVSPPLSLDDFTQGSAPGGSPTLDVLWFKGKGRVLLATVKIGPDATKFDVDALSSMVRSIRLGNP